MGALATTAPAGEAGGLAHVSYTREQIELVKRTVCVDSTDDELRLFLERCAKTGLDPFMRQIYSIKRGGKHTVQVGIDGLRLVAVRTGEADGQDGPQWCGEDGDWRDVWFGQTPPAACKVVVYRKGQSRGYSGVAHFREYFQANNGLWKSMPAQMLAKVAESLALRKAFPQELSGLYSSEEMDQADSTPPRQGTAAPARPVDPARLKAALVRTGWGWGRALGAINESRGTGYKVTVKPESVDQGVLADFLGWLEEQPDAPAKPTDAAPQPAAAADRGEVIEAEPAGEGGAT